MADKAGLLEKLTYFLTLRGIFRAINGCYFLFLFILVAILSGVAVGFGLTSGAMGFIAFLSFWIVIWEIILSILDILNLDFMKPYAFWSNLIELIFYSVEAALLFIACVSLIAYAATSGDNLNRGTSAAGAFFGFIGLIILGTTVGVWIFILLSSRGTKKSADPV